MKRFTKVCTVLMVMLMMVVLSVTTYAAGSVTYDGDAEKFIFKPGTKESPTNLFDEFQNVMPGDQLTEQIEIKNKSSNGTSVKIYLRSKGAQQGTSDFLSQMTLSVQQMNASKLFEASAEKTAQLSDWTSLGTLQAGGEVILNVGLTVPITMGNDYQDEIGYIDWEFKIEEIEESSSDEGGGLPGGIDSQPHSSGDIVTAVKTGDETPVIWYVGLLLISFMTAGTLYIRKKKYE